MAATHSYVHSFSDVLLRAVISGSEDDTSLYYRASDQNVSPILFHGSEAVPLIRPQYPEDKLVVFWNIPWNLPVKDAPLSYAYILRNPAWAGNERFVPCPQWRIKPNSILQTLSYLDYDVVVYLQHDYISFNSLDELTDYYNEISAVPLDAGRIRFRSYVRLQAPGISLQWVLFPKGFAWVARVLILDVFYPVLQHRGKYSISNLFVPSPDSLPDEQPLYLVAQPAITVLVTRGSCPPYSEYRQRFRKIPQTVKAYPKYEDTDTGTVYIRHPAHSGSEIRFWNTKEGAAVAEVDGIVHILITPSMFGRNRLGHYSRSYEVSPSGLGNQTRFPLPVLTLSYYAGLLRKREAQQSEQIIETHDPEDFYTRIRQSWEASVMTCMDFNARTQNQVGRQFTHPLLLDLDPEHFFGREGDEARHLNILRKLFITR